MSSISGLFKHNQPLLLPNARSMYLSAFSSMSEYSRVVYNRGLACLLALEETAGGLDTFLRDYYTSYAFSIASREDFEHTLAQSTGEDLTPLLRDYLDTSILN